MTIYTRFGTQVKFVTAREIPVWIERRSGEIKWHYKEPKRTKRTLELECVGIMHVTAMCDDDREGHGPKGRMILDGQEVSVDQFRADEGIAELIDAANAVMSAARQAA